MRPSTLSRAVLLASTLAGCGLGAGRCDEPDRQCGLPAVPANAVTLRLLRERNPRYPEGQPVNVRAVQVTAVDAYDEDMGGHVGTLYAQEFSPVGDPADRWSPCPMVPGGRQRVCAISTFGPTFAPTGYAPAVGDIVDITGGGYAEFDCSGVCGSPPQPFSDGRYIPQVSHPTVQRAGVAPPPAALEVTLDDLEAHNDALIGVLVTVADVTATGAPDRRGEIPLGPTLKMTQQFTPVPGVMAGTHWARVTGVVSYFYGPKLIPRGPGDLVAAQ